MLAHVLIKESKEIAVPFLGQREFGCSLQDIFQISCAMENKQTLPFSIFASLWGLGSIFSTLWFNLTLKIAC